MIKTAIIFVALLDLGTPPDIAAGAMLAAPLYAIPSHTMAGYLASGHPGARYSGRCGDPSIGGTCGPYRLHAMWARRYGAKASLRHHRVWSSLIAARMLSEARTRHYDGIHGRPPCEGRHDYRVHPKAGPGRRDTARAAWKVRNQVRLERELCGVWCRAAVVLH
jgi:hypothetical protein